MGRSTRSSEVELGHISGVFGVRGEVRLFLHNVASHLVEGRSHRVILAGPTGERREVGLSVRPGAGKRILGRIDGVEDRDAAAALKDWRLVMDRSALPSLEDDEFYVWQLVGAEVVVDGRALGRVVAVHTTGPIDVFELDLGAAEPAFVPALEEFVAEVDREGGRLVLHAQALES